jgi:aspartokinase/homoserine dehydrogenase 1
MLSLLKLLRTPICIGILNEDALKPPVLQSTRHLKSKFYNTKVDSCIENLCIIALVGERGNHQLSGKMFSTLEKIANIRAIAQGVLERNISAVINQRDVKKSIEYTSRAFLEDNTKQLNLFVMWVSNVGEKFIDQINQQKEVPKRKLKINLLRYRFV